MNADRATRAAEIWRRHRSAGRDMRGLRFWNNLTFETATLAVGAVLLVLLMFLEPGLWWSWPPWRGSREPLGWIALGLLMLAPISGVLVERYLAYRTPPRQALRPGLHLALGLLGSLPMAGFFLFPLARRWMTGPPGWAFRPRSASPDLEAVPDSLPRSSWWSWAFTSGAFALWLTATGVLLSFAGGLWLAAAGERKTLWAACIALHLVQAACVALYAASDLRFTHQPRRTLWLAALLCLLPQPASWLAMVPVLWTGSEASHQKTLIWSAYAQAGSVGRHAQWIDLRLALRQGWQNASWKNRWTRPQGLELPQRNGRAEAVRRTWMRAKALLLPLEASLAIGGLVAGSSRPRPGYDPLQDPALRPWLWVTVLLAALGFLQGLVGRLPGSLRLQHPTPLGPPAAGLYLLVTQSGLAVALLAGPLAAHGKFRELAVVTVLSAAFAVIFLVLFAMGSSLTSQPSVSPTAMAAWCACLLILALLPLALALRPSWAPVGLGLALLAPGVDATIGAWALPWLLYPFRRQDVFARHMATGVRVRLAFVMLVALLPLGGVLLPVWLSLGRERRRDG